MPSDLRPLTTLEVLDAAVLLTRRNGVRLYAYSSVGTLPLALLLMVYYQWLGSLVEGTDNQVFYSGTALWAVGMAAAWAFNSVVRSAVTLLVMADARGEALEATRPWPRAGRHAAGAAFVGLCSFCAAWIGGACLVAPGLLPALGWWTARPALLAEERPFGAALRRSWRLTEGQRSKSFGLWLLLAAVWVLGAANLYLLVQFVVSTAAGIFGIDTSALLPIIDWKNKAYVTFLLVVLFVLIDPLKTAVDAVLYLDLRIRREGADLLEQLRALRAGAPLGLILALCLLAAPAHALPAQDYLARVQSLRRQVEQSAAPEQVDRLAVGELRNQLVQMPGGQQISVENEWLPEGLQSWKTREDKVALLRRLDALERSLAGVAGDGKTPLMPVDVDPKQTVGQILQQPEFQELAKRPELRNLVKNVNLGQSRTWWDSFLDWLKKVLFKPPKVTPNAPQGNLPNLAFLEPLFYVLIGVAVLFVLALIVKAVVESPVRERTGRGAVSTEAPPLEASATENALDHTVDEWEVFAQQWLGRGDVRQAVRALYLATLVHLHRERRIDYNRAFTNWVYVRQYRGEAEQQKTLRRLTQTFDEVWYGERACGEDQYRVFEQGARDLGTPAPAGSAHG